MTTPVADELAAMRRIVAALDKLDPGAQLRVVVWLGERYDPAANTVEAWESRDA